MCQHKSLYGDFRRTPYILTACILFMLSITGSEASIGGMLIMSTLCCSAVKLSWHQYSIPCYDGKPDRSLRLPLQQITAFIPAKVKERACEGDGTEREGG